MKSHSNVSLIPGWLAARKFIGRVQALTVLFVACLASQAATLVNADLTGFASGGGKADEGFVVSGDGQLIAFSSTGTNHVAGDTNNISDIFVRDWAHRSNVWDTTFSLAPTTGGLSSLPLDFTLDGRFLLFRSRRHQPGSGSFLSQRSISAFCSGFAVKRDLLCNGVSRRSDPAFNSVFNGQGGLGDPRITPDGRFVAFVSGDTNLVSLSDTNQAYDLFCRDMVRGVTELISVSLDGTAALPRQTIPYA